MRRIWPWALVLGACADPVALAPIWLMGCEATQIHQFQEVQFGTGTGHQDEIYRARFLWCDPPWHIDEYGNLIRTPSHIETP